MYTRRGTTFSLLLFSMLAACSAADLTRGAPGTDVPVPPDTSVTVPPDTATPVASIQVTSSAGADWLWNAGKLALVATVRSASGAPILGRAFTWTSNNVGVSSVDTVGLVSGIAAGTATITVSAGGKTASLSLSVYAAPTQDLIYAGGMASASRLWILQPGTGRNPRAIPLQIPATEPSPSPDGRRVAFTGTDEDDNVDIYVVNRDGSNLVRLTWGSSIDDQPAWSPDGNTIAFRSTRSGWSDVWVMNANGARPRRLTPLPGADDVRIPEDMSERPAWSPDGRYIAYSRTIGAGAWIEVMNADGSGKRALTQGSLDNQPTWSPDGRIVTFVRRFAGHPEAVIMSVFAASGDQVILVNPPGAGTSPAYSADGRWLAREGPLGVNGWRGVLVIPLFGLDYTRIMANLGDGGARYPQWMTRQ